MFVRSIRKLLAGLGAVAAVTVLVAGEPALGDQEAEALAIQFYLTSGGDGHDCTNCCFTGYCCTVPVAECARPG